MRDLDPTSAQIVREAERRGIQVELLAPRAEYFRLTLGERSILCRESLSELTSAVGSMNHVAFSVPADRIEEYRDRLQAAGVPCTEVANHDDSEWGISEELHPGVFVRSIYFQDPDGVLLEFACWTKTFGPDDVGHAPATALDRVG